MKQALDANPGPYFLGPRIDFNYAVFGLRSPEGFPPTFCPGSWFPISAEPQIIQHWQQDRFETLIFLKDQGYPFYPQEFLDIIDRAYVRDDKTYPDITVYRLRGASAD